MKSIRVRRKSEYCIATLIARDPMHLCFIKGKLRHACFLTYIERHRELPLNLNFQQKTWKQIIPIQIVKENIAIYRFSIELWLIVKLKWSCAKVLIALNQRMPDKAYFLLFLIDYRFFYETLINFVDLNYNYKFRT